jgi:hypothetical protein
MTPPTAPLGEEQIVKSATILSFDKRPLPRIHLEEPSTAPLPASTPSKAANEPSALEAMPHLTSQIIRLWHTRELNTLIHNLLLDSRDGKRAGFPHEVAKELMFLAKMNVIVRAYEAAPMLGVSVSDACHLIEQGDNAALTQNKPGADIWGNTERSRLANLPRQPLRQHPHKDNKPARQTLPATPPAPELQVAPMLPKAVSLDLSTSRTLRDAQGKRVGDEGDLMDQGFFRCITKELGSLGISQLSLNDLGATRHCTWLPAAVSFTKDRCHFKTVILHTDPLSAQERLLTLAMAAGLDHLVINLNLASGKWRARAEAVHESDPDYFRKQLRRLLDSRDKITTRTGHRCQISVIQINHKSVFHLSQTFTQLAAEPGLTPFHHIAESRRNQEAGACHCWSPFIEAQIRTNGHLVACAQDHAGYSFAADLKATTFNEAWHSPAFRQTRQRVLHGDKPGRLCEICAFRLPGKTPKH